MQLIIVESPTKAKTFGKFLDKKDFSIISSMGHIRDLPKKKLGIDLEDNFEPDYEIIPGKKKVVDPLVREARKAEKVILATDPDREGEAIAYHIGDILRSKIKKKLAYDRIVFHEITESALREALGKSRPLNQELFDAQQARRVLDRIVGYKISPYLWKKFSKSWLSAGRVQTVALRIIVEREKERNKFKTEAYFSVKGFFDHGGPLEAKLVKLLGKEFYRTDKLELFDGKYEYQSSLLKDEKSAKEETGRLTTEKYAIAEVSENRSSRTPPPPFITSTLQQNAGSAFGFTAKRAMRIAQSLYEEGLITYHRTDSFNISEKFINEARAYIAKKYGQGYLSEKIRRYKQKSKLAQEAHEAIRPTNVQNHPDSQKLAGLRGEQRKLYFLIYNRSLSTQMKEAVILRQKILIVSGSDDVFRTEREQIMFPGFLILSMKEKKEKELITGLAKGQPIKLLDIELEEKATQPPPRYSEATLVKTLEARGIGRPSTYAPIISLIQERHYVEKQGRELVPSELGMSVSDLLVKKFVNVFDISFTAKMEDELDNVALGKIKWRDLVGRFYSPLSQELEVAYKDTDKIKVEEKTTEACPECGAMLVIKMSRFGRFYACSNFPKCRYTKSFLEKTGTACPECKQGELVVRFSRKKKRFYACDRYPDCRYTTLWLPKL